MTARRTVLQAALALVAALAPGATATATAADGAGWHSEQPLTPGGDVPSALGRISDLAFWAPNRGLLLTEKGLWAYDGTGWHPYATVCGATGGTIVWAGPTDFWTISDQPLGQANPTGESRGARSLCHFVNGAVVASYAQPLGQAGSYLPMTGGACTAPDDCWFGGARLPGTVNTGAFHLHWDGTTLTPWPSLAVRDPSLTDPDRGVAAMAVHQGMVYESVEVAGNAVAGEPDDQPFLLHEVQPGTPPAFTPLLPIDPINYGAAAPQDAAGLTLTSDGEGLWGVAGAKEPAVRPAGPLVVRLGPGGGLAPVALNDPQGLLTANAFYRDAAAEPGTGSVWVAYVPPLEADASVVQPARVVRVSADGTVGDAAGLPSAADGIARKGRADRVACAGPGQCWLATETGWLFHLGDPLPRDDEPAMHRLITYRPSDAATVIVSPDTLPDDDSGIAPPVFEQPAPEGYTPPTTAARPKAKRLVTGVKRRMITRTTLQVSFTLTARARVQLVAKRKKTVVARTKRRTLAKGQHKVTLKLDRRRWPTALDLRAEVAR